MVDLRRRRRSASDGLRTSSTNKTSHPVSTSYFASDGEFPRKGRRTELLYAVLVLDVLVASVDPLSALLKVVLERVAHLAVGAL